jgi:DNA-binding transcriptional ArsR family regulator
MIYDIEDTTAEARLFHALGNPIRLRVLLTLDEPMTVHDVNESIGSYPDSKLSYHLSLLAKRGLVTRTTQGNFRIYRRTALGDTVVRAVAAVRLGGGA